MKIGFTNQLKSIGGGAVIGLLSAVMILNFRSSVGVIILPITFISWIGISVGTYFGLKKFFTNKFLRRRNEIANLTNLTESHNHHLEEIILSLDDPSYSVFRELVLNNFNDSIDKRKTISYLQLWADHASQIILEKRERIKKEKRIQEENRRQMEINNQIEMQRIRELARAQSNQEHYPYINERQRRDSKAFSYFNTSGDIDINDKIGMGGNLDSKRVKEITGVKMKGNIKDKI